jgi:hypothetical protein
MNIKPNTKIPEEITTVIQSLLEPYVQGITSAKLADAIAFKPEPIQESLLSRKEASISLRVSIPTLDRLIRDGVLNRIRVRGRAFVRQSDVNRIINGKG